MTREPAREPPTRRRRRALGNARRWVATLLGVGVACGTMVLLVLQRAVAEIDDDEVRHDE